ncbi:MAG: hypothetical protein EU547_01855 [Promethearchaeota archaeon]|nr:MAG: hypothetical protein EU547_01855 [Candidatus Lokiarchaeota archaeon]
METTPASTKALMVDENNIYTSTYKNKITIWDKKKFSYNTEYKFFTGIKKFELIGHTSTIWGIYLHRNKIISFSNNEMISWDNITYEKKQIYSKTSEKYEEMKIKLVKNVLPIRGPLNGHKNLILAKNGNISPSPESYCLEFEILTIFRKGICAWGIDYNEIMRVGKKYRNVQIINSCKQRWKNTLNKFYEGKILVGVLKNQFEFIDFRTLKNNNEIFREFETIKKNIDLFLTE